jgi:hypothetical protein
LAELDLRLMTPHDHEFTQQGSSIVKFDGRRNMHFFLKTLATMDPQRLPDVLGSPAEWPCEICKPLVPDRKKTDEATYIHTTYRREDVYPDYPGLAASAASGCKLCNLFRHALISVGSLAAWRNDENDTHPFWDHDTGQDLSLKMNWDRRIAITATLHLMPFKPLHESDSFSLEGQPTQYNGMVHSLWLKYGPATRPLRSETGTELWSGSILEMSVFDSPGKSPSPSETIANNDSL